MFKTNQDVLTFIMVIIWLAMDLFLCFKFDSTYALICNLSWILLFTILILIKECNKKFYKWLFTPLKSERGSNFSLSFRYNI